MRVARAGNRDTKIMRINLDRRVRVAGVDLQPDLYQLRLIEHEGNQGELCFIARNKFHEERIAAVAPVKIVSLANESVAAPVVYGEKDGINTILMIGMPPRAFRLEKQTYSYRKYGNLA